MQTTTRLNTKRVTTDIRRKEQIAFSRRVTTAKRKNQRDGDLIPHFSDYDELKALSLSNSENKIAIAGSSIPLFDTGIQASKGLCTYYNWGSKEVTELLDGLFVRGVVVLQSEDLSKGEEEHALLSLFASDLFDQYCENNQVCPDYMRWGLSKKLLDKGLNHSNARILYAFSQLNP